MKTNFAVHVIEMSHYQDPEHEGAYDGFPTLELAREFARRWVRDSVEGLRKPDQTKEELRKAWWVFGEDAFTEGYKGSDELDYFIDHPATAEERDWESILNQAGIG
ncbi:MAG: hypothetical protein ACE5JO_06990 [Candidatus Binatia bacterium]